MKWAKEQLLDEAGYPHLAAFLRSGGTLVVGEDVSLRTFVAIRKGNRTIVVDAVYPDFAAILKEMDSQARSYLKQDSE
jgi:hypothetical protein